MKTTDRKYLAALRKRYARAGKKERGQMLDEYVRRRAVIANMGMVQVRLTLVSFSFRKIRLS